MKIVYLLGDENISSDNGVVKKVESQTSYWKKMGHTVKIISLRSKNLESILDDATIISEQNSNNNSLQNTIQQIKNYHSLNLLLAEHEPDIIYMRYLKYYPGMTSVLKKYTYIVEINSDEVEEAKHGSRARYTYNMLTRNFLLGNASGFVFVSKELMKNINYDKFKKPNVVIGNGYDFERDISMKKEFNKEVSLIFIGSPGQSWHGIDKILFLATSLPEHKFHIVGPSLEEMEKIAEVLPSNLKVYGYLSQDEANELVAKCDIGISTLALHRKKMNEASPLKSRQYLAQGLPVIIGYEDTDLQKEVPFVLNIGNYENNVRDSIDNIRNFIQQAIQLKPIAIAEEAKKILSYEEKEKVRMNFFQSIIEKD